MVEASGDPHLAMALDGTGHLARPHGTRADQAGERLGRGPRAAGTGKTDA